MLEEGWNNLVGLQGECLGTRNGRTPAGLELVESSGKVWHD
jgi:hypothetical protein